MQQVDLIDLAGMEVRAWVSGRKRMRCMKINQLLRLINGIVEERSNNAANMSRRDGCMLRRHSMLEISNFKIVNLLERIVTIDLDSNSRLGSCQVNMLKDGLIVIHSVPY